MPDLASPIPCKTCGQPFLRKSTANKYCSRECQAQGYEQTLTANRLARQRRPKVARRAKSKLCKLCGLAFIPKASPQLYCTEEHAQRARLRRLPSTFTTQETSNVDPR